jgi:hypothetical protein
MDGKWRHSHPVDMGLQVRALNTSARVEATPELKPYLVGVLGDSS